MAPLLRPFNRSKGNAAEGRLSSADAGCCAEASAGKRNAKARRVQVIDDNLQLTSPCALESAMNCDVYLKERHALFLWLVSIAPRSRGGRTNTGWTKDFRDPVQHLSRSGWERRGIRRQHRRAPSSDERYPDREHN